MSVRTKGLIDLTKVPENATHYMPANNDSHFCWVNFQDKDHPSQMYIICAENNVHGWTKFTPYLDDDEELFIYEIPKVYHIEVIIKETN